MILAIRTDKPEAELYLLMSGDQVKSIRWLADRQLADTLLPKIDQLLAEKKVGYAGIEGIIVFTGEGSFTGLRIGTAVANTIAYAQKIPIVATTDKDWLKTGLAGLFNAKPNRFVKPIYGRGPNISKPK